MVCRLCVDFWTAAELLDHVVVDAYGERQPLSGLAQVTMRNPQLIMVSPFDTAVRHLDRIAGYADAALNFNRC